MRSKELPEAAIEHISTFCYKHDMPQFDHHLEKLLEFLRIPSVSSLPENANDVVLAAEFLVKELKELGFVEPEFTWAKGMESHAPIVYAEKIANPQNPTILLYGHYDVQPVDPIEEWTTDPFDPVVKDGQIKARGAGDDKGQIMTHIAALQELHEEWEDKWPINLKVIFEGEEESGGENIESWLQEEKTKALLKADIAILSDTGFATKDTPAITYGLRGIAYFQIDVTLGSTDLHSGEFGGGVLNPANSAAYIMNKLYDVETGKVLIPGFYDDVVDVRDGEREKLANVPFSAEEFYKDAGNAAAYTGEKEFTLKERISARPTLDINGFWSGFTGEGAKTIIPSSAHIKFSTRLVANQNPEKIGQLVVEYIDTIKPQGVSVTTTIIHTGNSVLVDTSSPWVQKVANALKEIFGKEPAFDRIGGSIPLVALMKSKLDLDAIMFGYTLPEDHFHAPNEKLDVEQFRKGIEANKLIYKSFAEK